MIPYLDSKIADASEIQSRLEMLDRAIKAMQEQRQPAMRALLLASKQAVAAFDAANPSNPDHPARQAIIDHYDAIIIPLCREAISFREPLDCLIEFYTGRDIDHHDVTLH